jgi:hypothetical protein
MATEKLIVELDAKTQKLDKALKSTDKKLSTLDKQTKKTDKSFDKLSKTASNSSSSFISLNKMIVAGSAAMLALSVVTKKAITISDEYNVSQIRTEAVLKATGNAAGFTSGQLREQADALALTTLASTKGVQEAQAKLLTFNKISGDIFTETIELSQDLAELGFGSVSSSALQLGKALQDPATGLSMLNRVGITFSSTQKEQIKLLSETGRSAEAQRIILATLQKQVGGVGAAVAKDSLAGKMDTASQRYDEFAENLGKKSGLLKAAKWSVDQLAGSFDYLSAALALPDIDDTLATAQNTMDGLNSTIGKQSEKLAGANKELERSQGNYIKQIDSRMKISKIESNLARLEKEKIKRAAELDAATKAVEDRDEKIAQAKIDSEKVKEATILENKKAAVAAEAVIVKKAAEDAEEKRAAAEAVIADRLETDEQRLLDRYNNELVLIGENNDLKLGLEQEYQDNLAAIKQAAADADAVREVELSSVFSNLAGDDADEIDKKNKDKEKSDAAYLSAALSIGNTLAAGNEDVQKLSIVANTAAGITRQFSDLPYPAALATSAAIAISGLTQLSNVGSGSISGGTGAAPATTQPEPTTELTVSDTDASGASASQILTIKIDSDDSELAVALSGILGKAKVDGVIS